MIVSRSRRFILGICIRCLYGRLPERKDQFRCDGKADCSFVFGLWRGALCPLALMESADPRLISPLSFSP